MPQTVRRIASLILLGVLTLAPATGTLCETWCARGASAHLENAAPPCHKASGGQLALRADGDHDCDGHLEVEEAWIPNDRQRRGGAPRSAAMPVVAASFPNSTAQAAAATAGPSPVPVLPFARSTVLRI